MPQQIDIDFRLSFLERALIESTIRIQELAERLALMESGSAMAAAQPAEPFDVRAEEISPFATGFYAKEADNDNRTYRWTGSANFFELRFALNRDVAWSFNMQIATNPNVNVRELRAFADYAEIQSSIDAGEQNVSGTIPTKRFSNIVTLSFYQPSVFVPQELDPTSEDRRSLGIVFYSLLLKPLGTESAKEKANGGFFSKAFR